MIGEGSGARSPFHWFGCFGLAFSFRNDFASMGGAGIRSGISIVPVNRLGSSPQPGARIRTNASPQTGKTRAIGVERDGNAIRYLPKEDGVTINTRGTSSTPGESALNRNPIRPTTPAEDRNLTSAHHFCAP